MTSLIERVERAVLWVRRAMCEHQGTETTHEWDETLQRWVHKGTTCSFCGRSMSADVRATPPTHNPHEPLSWLDPS